MKTKVLKDEISTNVPLFPLSVFLLPEGITRLRIFEKRYLKMVPLALKGEGFVIYPTNTKDNHQSMHRGSWVDIINFDQSDDGILEIDVKCKHLVEITGLTRDEDNLHHSDISVINHWSENNINEEIGSLSSSLSSLFSKEKHIGHLYAEHSLNNENWVVARWLELLPLPMDIKLSFVEQHQYSEAKELVSSIVLNNQETEL